MLYSRSRQEPSILNGAGAKKLLTTVSGLVELENLKQYRNTVISNYRTTPEAVYTFFNPFLQCGGSETF